MPHAAAFTLTDPARPDRANEDAAVLAGDVAVVVDGAGIPQRFRAGCSHSVAWYSHALAEELARRLREPEAGMRAALAAAITTIAGLHGDDCDLAAGSPSGTVVAVRRDRAAGVLEHLVLCDSSLLLAMRDGSVERITDTRVDHLVLDEHTPEAVEAQRNAPGGFWIARHEVEAAEEALVGSTPLAELSCAILVSDGVTRAVDLLGMMDDAQLAHRCADVRSACGLLTELRAEEEARASSGSPMPVKIHDDATVVMLPARSSDTDVV